MIERLERVQTQLSIMFDIFWMTSLQNLHLERVLPPHEYIGPFNAYYQAAKEFQEAIAQLITLTCLELHDICFAYQMVHDKSTSCPLKTLRYILLLK